MIKIEASILSADFGRLSEQAREAETAGADAIQIDVMDGCFVPEITFGSGIVGKLHRVVRIPLDVHLMIVEPERHLTAFVDAGADRIIVHQEVCPHLHRVLQSIRELKVEAGVTLNPATPLTVLEDVLDLSDFIQVMTVNPGWGGQKFIESQIDKIRRLRKMLDERGLNVPIGVDGGVNPTTAPLIVEAGATVLIAGSSVYNNTASVAENIKVLRASARR